MHRPRSICTLTLSTSPVAHVISSIWINRTTTRSRCKFRICTATNDLTLYCFSSLYIFVTPLTSSGQRSRASWASQPQKSTTLSPQPGGKPRKVHKNMWWYWGGKYIYIFLWPEGGPQWPKHVVSLIKQDTKTVVFWRTYPLLTCTIGYAAKGH